MATLTSTGAVNLTSSTNWSPAQTPAAGDDLVIAAHTLTLDADFTGAGALGSVTFNNASSRLAISGTTRSVQATNGWFVTANVNAALCTTAISSGMSVTLTGKWLVSAAVNSFAVAQGTGGDLTLQTVGASQSNVLFESSTNAAQSIIQSWTSGTLATIGRLDGSKAGQPTSFVIISGGQWTHQSVGYNYVGTGNTRLCSVSGAARITWTGSVDSISLTSGGSCFNLTGSDTGCSIGQSGDTFVQRAAVSGGASSVVYHTGTGTVALTGKFVSKNKANTFIAVGGTIQYRNQSVSVLSDELLGGYLVSGTLDLSGLVVSNAGKFAFLELGSGAIVASAGTSITNTTSSAQAAAYTTALDGKIVTLPSPAPTLPAVQNVAAGTSYGYAASPLTGTGIINDPAALASALRTGIGMASANMDTQLNAILDKEVTVTPLAAGDTQRVDGTDVVAYIGEVSDITVYAVTDVDGNAVNLSTKTLRIYIQELFGGDVIQTIEDAAITVSGANNNNFTFTPSSDVTETRRKLDWSLRDVNDGEKVLAHGTLDVQNAAWST